MPTVIQNREQRVALRIRPKDKLILEKAASSCGLSLTAFILSYSLRAAQAGHVGIDRITLNHTEWTRFMASLEDPPPRPNKALLAIAKKHGYN